MSSIVIVDLGTGNLRSVSKAMEFVSDRPVRITDDPDTIREAEHLVLPGQGAIGTWVKQLRSSESLQQAVSHRLQDGPVLGICLGLQALYSHSEENGGTEGLKILNGSVKHFAHHEAHHSPPNGVRYKVPHMGWNEVEQTHSHPLWQGIANGERFYFVHSYYVQSADAEEEVGQCQYGNRFTAAAAKNNLFATQFHPEKSQQAGLQLLKNFINWNGCS